MWRWETKRNTTQHLKRNATGQSDPFARIKQKVGGYRGVTYRQISRTRLASPLIDDTFIAASLMPSGVMTFGVLSCRPCLATASLDCTIFSNCGVVYGWKLIRTMPQWKSATNDETWNVFDVPSRLRTRPVMTRSGRSMVFATASTMSFEPTIVGQLKKL